jgi:hypothetical protein
MAITSNGGYVKIIWPLNAGAASFLPITPVNRSPIIIKPPIIIDYPPNPTPIYSTHP